MPTAQPHGLHPTEACKERYAALLAGLSHIDLTRWHYNTCTGELVLCNAEMLGPKLGLQNSTQSLVALMERIHPDDLAQAQSIACQLLPTSSSGTLLEQFIRVKTVDGGYEWLVVQGYFFKSDVAAPGPSFLTGNIRYAAGLLASQDFLEEKLQENAMIRDRQLLALEASRDGFWDWNTEQQTVYFDPRYITMMGYTLENFPQELDSWVNRVHKEDIDHILHHHFAYIDSPDNGDNFDCVYRFLAADAAYRWVLARGKVVARDASGRARRLVGTHTDITELRTTQEALMQIAKYDSLTKLHSRWYFEKSCAEIAADSTPIAIMYIDVDGLKLANDLMGHNAGDSLLIKTADLLRTVLRSSDIIARIGGDEFAVLMPGCTHAAALAVAQKVQAATVQNNNSSEGLPLFLSLGTAATDAGIAFDMLLSTADARMLHNKAAHNKKHHEAMRVWLEQHKDRRVKTCCSDTRRKDRRSQNRKL